MPCPSHHRTRQLAKTMACTMLLVWKWIRKQNLTLASLGFWFHLIHLYG
jgi:hypothetical protein